jgi:hypothetical protein
LWLDPEISSCFIQLFGAVVDRTRRGVTLKDIEKEPYSYERLKRITLRGLFDGFLLKGYMGNSFEEKFENYLYNSGVEDCRWITKTGYDIYYRTLHVYVLKLNINVSVKNLVKEYMKEKGRSITQVITKILTKKKFFENNPKTDETVINEHIEIFRELGGIAESYLKLIYGLK